MMAYNETHLAVIVDDNQMAKHLGTLLAMTRRGSVVIPSDNPVQVIADWGHEGTMFASISTVPFEGASIKVQLNDFRNIDNPMRTFYNYLSENDFLNDFVDVENVVDKLDSLYEPDGMVDHKQEHIIQFLSDYMLEDLLIYLKHEDLAPRMERLVEEHYKDNEKYIATKVKQAKLTMVNGTRMAFVSSEKAKKRIAAELLKNNDFVFNLSEGYNGVYVMLRSNKYNATKLAEMLSENPDKIKGNKRAAFFPINGIKTNNTIVADAVTDYINSIESRND